MNMIIISKNLPRILARGFSMTTVKQDGATLANFKKKQADMQCDDGKPIWLKRGMNDRILYTTTLVLCGLGTLMTFMVIYDNAKPTSWKTPTC